MSLDWKEQRHLIGKKRIRKQLSSKHRPLFMKNYTTKDRSRSAGNRDKTWRELPLKSTTGLLSTCSISPATMNWWFPSLISALLEISECYAPPQFWIPCCVYSSIYCFTSISVLTFYVGYVGKNTTCVLGSQIFRFSGVISVPTVDWDDEILDFKPESDVLIGSELRLWGWREGYFECGRDTELLGVEDRL